ncbi:hypothetical protein HAH_1250 [Haloarcula hispanica ATCC 33960]|nr:hypothetical protein HAH_1250 [Haloarcula hispanica ATCC 33960]
MVFIGVYELTIGLLFLLQKIRAIFFLFLGHQFVTLATLVIARSAYFQEPFLLGTVPWLFDAFAAYILKNTIFIGGFLVLAAVELGQGSPEAATAKSAKMESAVSTD